LKNLLGCPTQHEAQQTMPTATICAKFSQSAKIANKSVIRKQNCRFFCFTNAYARAEEQFQSKTLA
jgi:hypothetical protein